jgi:REP element-mobilizing transposase RayT
MWYYYGKSIGVISMPRSARVKNIECAYHVMCRSTSEILLFRDDQDKTYYLELLKRYLDKFKCLLYSYCLMDNHLHLLLDLQGFDISKFMHCTNTAYVKYYNKKYERHGPVFQDRFLSKVIDSDEFLLAVSAYVHKNPKDLGYKGKEQQYYYSSYGVYLGIREDTLGIVDTSFIMSLFTKQNINRFTRIYYEYVSRQKDVGSINEINKVLDILPENTYISGRRIILREIPASKVISYISDRFMIHNPAAGVMTKSKRKLSKFREFTAYVLRVLSGLDYRAICNNMCNMTISGCAKLCDRGYALLGKDKLCDQLFQELIELQIA